MIYNVCVMQRTGGAVVMAASVQLQLKLGIINMVTHLHTRQLVQS